MADVIKVKESLAAREDFESEVVERFHNKNYYNPEYMYNTEGPEILRLYNERDNTQHFTFTDVLDATYNNVNRSCYSVVLSLILLSHVFLCFPLRL